MKRQFYSSHGHLEVMWDSVWREVELPKLQHLKTPDLPDILQSKVKSFNYSFKIINIRNFEL